MSDVFISYAREDQVMARDLADDLKARGFNVWWDIELLASDDFYEVILGALSNARAAIVIWTAASASSRFVRDEARFALHQNKLIATRVRELDVYSIPFGFQGQHTEDVSNRDRIARAIEKLGVHPSLALQLALDAADDKQAWERVKSSRDPGALLTFIDSHAGSPHRQAAVERLRLLIAEGATPSPKATPRIRMGTLALFFAGLTFRVPSFQLSTQGLVTSIGSAVGAVILLLLGFFLVAGLADYVERSLGWSKTAEGLLAAAFVVALSLFSWSRFHKWLKQRNLGAGIIMGLMSVLMTVAIALPTTDFLTPATNDRFAIGLGVLSLIYACWQIWRVR
jgi:hypothetical protein